MTPLRASDEQHTLRQTHNNIGGVRSDDTVNRLFDDGEWPRRIPRDALPRAASRVGRFPRFTRRSIRVRSDHSRFEGMVRSGCRTSRRSPALWDNTSHLHRRYAACIRDDLAEALPGGLRLKAEGSERTSPGSRGRCAGRGGDEPCGDSHREGRWNYRAGQ